MQNLSTAELTNYLKNLADLERMICRQKEIAQQNAVIAKNTEAIKYIALING